MFPDSNDPQLLQTQRRLESLTPQQLACLSQELQTFKHSSLFKLYKAEYQEAHQQLVDNIFSMTPQDTDGVIILLQTLACGREQRERMEYFEELEKETQNEAKERQIDENLE